MRPAIDDETLEHIGILAKLSVSDKGKTKQALEEMLDYVDKLNELDTTDVEPMTHIFDEVNVFRDDEICNEDGREALMKNAVMSDGKNLIVPKTVG